MPEDLTPPAAVTPSDDPYGDPKMWYASAELWSAAIALIAFIAQGISGHEILPMEIQGSVVIIWMSILRGFKTNSPIAWSKKQLSRMQQFV